MREIKFLGFMQIKDGGVKMENSRFKFRAWEKTSKEMVYDVQNVSRKRIIGESACESFQEVIESWEYEIMQYTGLKDKNGREIYEGDIVEQELLGNVPLDFGSFIGVVKFIDGTYMIENAEGTFGVELFSETNPNEVIGNIYENPSLLEGDANADEV